MSSLSVGAVVVHYRAPRALESTVRGLDTQTLPPAAVIVVDNSVGIDNDFQVADHVEVLVADDNGGYAAAVNAGMGALSNRQLDAVLVLTHECLLERNALRSMATQLAAFPDVGAVGPLLAWRSRPEVVWSAGGIIEQRTFDLTHVSQPPHVEDWRGRPPHEVDWLDGACLLLRTEALATVGPFDERFFLYFEEADHLTRMRKHGWRLLCVPDARGSQEPSGMPVYLAYRNRLLFLRRHAPHRVPAEALRLLRRVAAYACRREERVATLPALRGLRDGLRGRGGGPRSESWLGARLNPRWEEPRRILETTREPPASRPARPGGETRRDGRG